MSKELQRQVKAAPDNMGDMGGDMPPPVEGGELGTASEPTEKFGAQVLRQIHTDLLAILETYDGYREHLDHEEIDAFVQSKLEKTVQEIEELEAEFSKHYPEYDALGNDLDTDEDMENAEGDFEEAAEDDEEAGDLAEEQAEGDEAEEADSTEEEEVPEEEAIEGMQTKELTGTEVKQLKAKYKGLPSDKVTPQKARAILKDGEVRGHKLTEKQRGLFGAAASRGKSIEILGNCEGHMVYKFLETANGTPE